MKVSVEDSREREEVSVDGEERMGEAERPRTAEMGPTSVSNSEM